MIIYDVSSGINDKVGINKRYDVKGRLQIMFLILEFLVSENNCKILPKKNPWTSFCFLSLDSGDSHVEKLEFLTNVGSF